MMSVAPLRLFRLFSFVQASLPQVNISKPRRLSPAHHLYAKSQDAPSELTQRIGGREKHFYA